MTQWEYLTQKDTLDDARLTNKLNNLGKLGWELVSVCDRPTGAIYIFKRQDRSTRTLFDETLSVTACAHE